MTALISALHAPGCYPHPVTTVRLIETHISWVLLTGDFAYKIKKPVRLDFLDFSTLERRRGYCIEELRLNRRLAPQLYLDVVPITGSEREPKIAGAGPAIEYALKMREFPQEALLVNRLAQAEVAPRHIDALADALVAFHAQAARAQPSDEAATAPMVLQAAIDNFIAIERLLTADDMRLRMTALKRWTQECHTRLTATFTKRRTEGRIRECHGDLHAGNIALLDDVPAIFDCIEFNAEFRWIDVMSEIAFVVMDLVGRGRRDFAYRLLNRYLEGSGDYAGLEVLRYYMAYRALVRAKIDCIRAHEPDLPEDLRARMWERFVARITLAERFAAEAPRVLAITHGLAGSGKSFTALRAAEDAAMIRIRSDVERKRLHDLRAGDQSRSMIDAGIYSSGATSMVYEHLAYLSTQALEAGFAVIVDAAFLERERRERFRRLAASLRAKFVIVHCRASIDELRLRIERRQTVGGDPSEASAAVLEHQLRIIEPLDETERASTMDVDTADAGSVAELVRALDTRSE